MLQLRQRQRSCPATRTELAAMSSVSFAVMSDLHLETPSARPSYSDFSIDSTCPYLVLLGDIGLVNDSRLFSFLEEQLQRFKIIFYVIGNHEPYDSDLDTAKAELRAFEERVSFHESHDSVGKFVLLDHVRFDVTPTVTVLGCTLFSAIDPDQVPSIKLFVSDFERMQNWSIESHNSAHRSDLAWLNDQVSEISRCEPQRKLLIFTHYCPTVQAAAHNPRHLKDESSVASAFMTDLSAEPCWTLSSVVLWAFGHTHFNCDFIDSATGKRVFSNQKGYRRSEVEDFDLQKVVTVNSGATGAKSKANSRALPKHDQIKQKCLVS